MLQESERQGSWIIEGVVRFCLVAVGLGRTVVLVAGCFLALSCRLAWRFLVGMDCIKLLFWVIS
jgi:hypothetical protein